MKKITLLLMLFVTSLLTSQNTVSVDASKTWKSYVAAFNVSDGNYAFGFDYDFAKNKSTFTGNVLTMQPNFAIWADNAASWDAGWFSASETPNKTVEVSGFVEDNSLAGSDLTFSGNLDSYTIASGYTVKAFIKALDPGNNYATVTNKTFTLTDAVSTFSVSASASELLAGHIIQYGFSVTGLIANPAEESNLGSVVVSNPANSSQTATYDLLETFDETGLEGAFGGTSAVYDADPTDANTQVVKITSTNGSGEVWQGTDVTLTTPYTLTAATQLSMQLDVYSTTAITIAPKAQGGVDGAPNAVTSVSHTGSGWETLTFTFDQTLDNQGPANGDYSDFALHTNWDTSANGFGTPDGRVFYIKNLKGLPTTLPEDPAPTDAPTTPPTRDAADVISLFSDAYDDITFDEFGTTWDSAEYTDETIAGNNVKKVSFASGQNATFLALDFTSNRINATDFTHLHIDIWTETETLDKSFNHKLSIHANEAAGETSAIEFSTTNASSPALPNPNPGDWISYDIPLSSFTIAGGGTLSRDKVGQYLITSNLGVVYVDNIYIYRDGTASVDNNKLLGFSMFPNPAKTQLQISAKETITKADVFNVLGRNVKSFTVNNTSTSLDISELSKGIYLIKYESAGRVGTAKFIKE